MSSSAQNSQLDATIEALRGGLTSAQSDAASTIESWITTLRGAGNPTFDSVADDLESLHTQLSGGAPDGVKISSTLRSLGEKTSGAASSAEGVTADKLNELGSLLNQAADQLA